MRPLLCLLIASAGLWTLAAGVAAPPARAAGPNEADPMAAAEHPEPPVLTGIDVLRRSDFDVLQGRRVGLITNQTGVDRQGVSTLQILQQAPQVELVAVFSPEHGISGGLDQPRIADARDPLTDLRIFSLYGETLRPTPESLKGIDTLVLDIQDVGARFYTYISTMGYAMEAAARHGIRFVVLDRPNPINGIDVAGPMLDAGSESFVGYHRLPVRHGMTVGELARMFNAQRQLGVDLRVVPMTGWHRDRLYDATGLPWIDPSPNMRSLVEALLYPGIGLLETTNLSVGRGTDSPFELVGAPWVDGQRLAGELNRAGLPGVRMVQVRFTPAASRYAGSECGGIKLVIIDRARIRPVRTGLEIARQLHRLYPDHWDTSRLNVLLGNRRVLSALLSGRTVGEIESLYEADLEAFLRDRESFLLYP